MGIIHEDDDARLMTAADTLEKTGFSSGENARDWVYERVCAGDSVDSICQRVEDAIGVSLGGAK